VFAAILPAHARRLVSEASEARNSWAHRGPIPPAEADDSVRAIAELTALFPGQGHGRGTAPLWSVAPPPAPFRLPSRGAATTAAAARPAWRQPRARPRGRRRLRGCAIALLLLLVPAALCGLGSIALRVSGGAVPAATRTATATTSARVTPSPVVPKPTATVVKPPPTVAGTARYTVAATGGIGVYLRVAPDSQERLRAYPEGTLLQSIDAAPTSTGSGRWRHVRAPDGTEGWMREKYLAPAP